MNRFQEIAESTSVLEQLKKQLGLDKAEITVHDTMGHGGVERIFSLNFKVNQSLQTSTNKPMLPFFRELLDDVRNSPIVREERKELENKLKMANAAADELLGRIKELEKYKIHYEMAYALAQGKESVIEVKK